MDETSLQNIRKALADPEIRDKAATLFQRYTETLPEETRQKLDSMPLAAIDPQASWTDWLANLKPIIKLLLPGIPPWIWDVIQMAIEMLKENKFDQNTIRSLLNMFLTLFFPGGAE